MTYRFFLLLLFITISSGKGQELMNGKLVDKETSLPVKFALIELNDTTVSSNNLGSFKCFSSKGAALTITHNSYEIGLEAIPETNKFTIELNPHFYNMGVLRLNFSTKYNIDYNNSTATYLKNLGFIAEYKGGFNEFYQSIIEGLVNDSTLSKKFELNIRFSISENGKVKLISFSDLSISGINVIRDLLESKQWKPGKQGYNASEQYFEIQISNAQEKFKIVDTPSVPKGGYQGFYKFISKKLKYPREAKRQGIEGKVYIEFVVNETGALSDAKVRQGLGFGLDEEALRIIKICPNWSPPMSEGIPVKQRIILPITFKL